MKEIKIFNSKNVAFIDDDDYKNVSQYRWSMSADGYAKTNVMINKKWTTICMHRIILKTKIILDHVDGNPLNNQKYNLRECTRGENSRNQKTRCNNTSGYKGVSWNDEKGKWVSRIHFNYKSHYIGSFNCKHEAARTYNKKALELFGEFARLNIIEGE